MSHWFDKMATAAAGEGEGEGVSRRRALKGAAVAAFAASPLASPVAARAAIELESRAASVGCDACVFGTIRAHNSAMRSCDKTGSMWGTVPKGKKKGKARPVNAAKRLACAMKERAEFAEDLNVCRRRSCANEPIQPLVPDPNSPFAPKKPGTSACPPGLHSCTDGSCCFGTDLCCYCIHLPGYQCCVASVGCACCPQS